MQQTVTKVRMQILLWQLSCRFRRLSIAVWPGSQSEQLGRHGGCNGNTAICCVQAHPPSIRRCLTQ